MAFLSIIIRKTVSKLPYAHSNYNEIGKLGQKMYCIYSTCAVLRIIPQYMSIMLFFCTVFANDDAQKCHRLYSFSESLKGL